MEFANIIATLHHSKSSSQSHLPIPDSSFLLLGSPPSNMATSFKDLIPHFFGRDVNDEGGQENPAEFIENLNFAVDGQIYTDKTRKLTVTRVIFRTHLQDKILLWYHGLSAKIRANWQVLEKAFLSRFALTPQKKVNQTRFLNLVFNFRQRRQSIVEYTKEEDQLNAECPEKFRDVLGHQFIAGLDDRGKVDLVQVYLGANKSTVSYEEAKSVVEKAYQRFGEPSLFNNLNDQSSLPPPTPALHSELVALLQSLRIPQAAPPSRDNPSYQPNYANGNSRDQNRCPLFYCGIYCHNCHEKGDYSTSCPWPVVSGVQRDVNKRAIDELQGGPRQYPRGPGSAGLLLAPAVPAAVSCGGKDREEQGGRRMNNIEGANVVILEQPNVEEVDDNLKYPPTYPINAATQSQKKNLESKKFQPTQVTRPVERDSEKAFANQTLRNLN